MFKLYILSAVANQIDAGDLKWDQQLTITEQIKSLPTGALQNKPDGTMNRPGNHAAVLWAAASGNEPEFSS